MEASGGRLGRLKKAKKPSSESAKVLQAAVAQLHSSKGKHTKEGKEYAFLGDSDDESPRGGDSGVQTSKNDAQAAADAQLICVAVLGPGRSCKTKRNLGSMYCWRHAPLDPNSDSAFCRFADPDTHKKCSNAIPKSKKPLLCAHHMHRAQEFITDEAVMNGATQAEITAMLAAAAAARPAPSATTSVISLDD